MKARLSWTVEGDRNISFFHTLALVRRRWHHITNMKDRRGDWLNGERDIVEFIRQSFIDLFTTSRTSVHACEWQHPFWHCELKDVDKSILERQISDREIFDALFSLKPYKAPSVDGLHAGFFQWFWLVVGELVKKEVNEIFSSGKVPFYLDQTLITLIPKLRVRNHWTITNQLGFVIRYTKWLQKSSWLAFDHSWLIWSQLCKRPLYLEGKALIMQSSSRN